MRQLTFIEQLRDTFFSPDHGPGLLVSFAMVNIVFAIVLLPVFRKYTGVSFFKTLLALGGGLFFSFFQVTDMVYRSGRDPLALTSAGVCLLFVIGFVLRLWGGWIGGRATEEEQIPGVPGLRAWFGASNIVMVAFIVGLAWAGYDVSPWSSAVVCVAALAAYPLLRSDTFVPVPAASEGLSAEREKILAMLEAGKLTADESAELLHALGESAPHPERRSPMTNGQRLVLIGATLVLVGFFLPWFVIDSGKEVARMVGKIQSSMPAPFSDMAMPGMQLQTGSYTFSGGDIGRGLGWVALLLGLVSGTLSLLFTNLDAATERTVRLLCVAVGGIIVLYLVSQNFRYIGIGLVLVFIGYVVQAVAIFRERQGQAVLATASAVNSPCRK